LLAVFGLSAQKHIGLRIVQSHLVMLVVNHKRTLHTRSEQMTDLWHTVIGHGGGWLRKVPPVTARTGATLA